MAVRVVHQPEKLLLTDSGSNTTGDVRDLHTLLRDFRLPDDCNNGLWFSGLSEHALPVTRHGHSAAQPPLPYYIRERARHSILLGSDRQNCDLDWSQPERKASRVAFEERCGHSLHRPDSPSMDHHRSMVATVGADIGQVESARLVEVELHGGDGFLVATSVVNLQIELGTVESGLTWGFDQVRPMLVEDGSPAARVAPERAPIALRFRATRPKSRVESRT